MPDGDRAEIVFAAWYEAQEQGAAVAPERLLAAHPDLADDLRARLLALDLIDGYLVSADPATPQRIGPYRLVRALGSGGMGSVHLAEVETADAGLEVGSHLALKLLHPHLMARPGFFRRFLREADLGRRVEHPNVVRTFAADALVVDGTTHHFLVMEYVEGRTLSALVEEVDRLPESLCRHVAAEVAKGLTAIHDAGAVHRDLKPDNVLITDENVVKVMDLGVARLAEETLKLSQTGAFVGSLPYAAPEQFRGGHVPVDGRADLHALGVLLYEISAGVHPFDDDDACVVMRRVLDEAPRRLGEVNPQISPFFEELVHALLAKSPDERFASADELLAVLDEAEASGWWHDRARALRRQTKQPLRRIRIPRETAVYGRDADLDRLSELYRAAKSGDGRVLLLEGEAGIGKTRLVDELVSRLVASGEQVSFLFASYPPGGAATASGAFSSAYREHLGDEDLKEAVERVLPDTPLLVPAFTALLSGDAAPADAVALTKDSLQTCFVHATRNLAAERTTIVLIDDLHFAPEEGRALFTSVALAVPGHRVLLVGTMRPGVPEDWTANLTRLDQTTHAVLERLGPKDLFALLKDSFRSERLAEEIGMRIAVKSDGNPFFVFEIIRGLREGQFLRQRHDGTWETTRIVEEIEVPSSVLDLVNARVADLTDDERHLLDVSACWGFEFDPGLIADALGLPRIATLQLLALIEKRYRLVRSAGRRFVFDHHQVQEALYGALPEMLREAYHAALAGTLEARTRAGETAAGEVDGMLSVDLCSQFLMGAQGERALRYYGRAFAYLKDSYLYEDAARLGERALAVPGLLSGTDRVRALVDLSSQALGALGRRERQEEVAREAARIAEQTGDAEARCSAACCVGVVYGMSGRSAEAEEAFERALDMAREREDRAGELTALNLLGDFLLNVQRLDEALACATRVVDLCQELGAPKHEISNINRVGVVHAQRGDFATARVIFDHALALARARRERPNEMRCLGNLANLLSSTEQLDESREYHERTLELARECGDRPGVAHAITGIGNLDRRAGRLEGARRHYERSMAIAREVRAPYQDAVAMVNLGETWRGLGDLDRAAATLYDCLARARAIGARHPEGYAIQWSGAVALDRGDFGGARSLTVEALALRRAIQDGRGVAESLIELGELDLRDRRTDAARAALVEALALVSEQSCAGMRGLTLSLLARLPGGDAGAAERALTEAPELDLTRRSRWHLWNASGRSAHLAQAKRLLEEALAKVPEEYHEGMLTNVRVNREIAEAAREAGL